MKIEITQFPDGFRLKHYSSGIFSKKKKKDSFRWGLKGGTNNPKPDRNT